MTATAERLETENWKGVRIIWSGKKGTQYAIDTNSFGKDDRKKRQLTNDDEDEGKTFFEWWQSIESLTHFQLNDC